MAERKQGLVDLLTRIGDAKIGFQNLDQTLTTTMLDREWQAALKWRERFLNPERECEIASLDQQIVCYLIADCMTMRAFHDAHEVAGSRLSDCHWQQDADSGAWQTDCGVTFEFIDDGPAENEMHFCYHCGKRLVVGP